MELLSRAEHHLIGRTHSSQWWSRLHSLRLRVYGMLRPLGQSASKSLVFRKTPPDRGIFEAYSQLSRIAMEDKLRRFRAIKYFSDAEAWFRGFLKSKDAPMPETLKLAKKDLARLEKDVKKGAGLYKQAINNVRQRKIWKADPDDGVNS